MTAAAQQTWGETVVARPAHHLTVLPTPHPLPTVDEVRTWPGVWDVQDRFTGWIVYPDPSQMAEHAVESARKLAEVTGRSVVIERMVIAP